MIRSMTGYGQAIKDVGDSAAHVEVNTLNGKFLSIDTDIPRCLERFRSALDRLVRSRMSRGVVKLRLQLPEFDDNTFELDEERLEKYWKCLSDKARNLGIEPNVDPASLAALPGVIRRKGAAAVTDEQWQGIASVVGSALDALVEDRGREGDSTCRELQRILALVKAEISKLREIIPKVNEERYAKYRERVSKLLADAVPEEAVAREVAIISEKHDITEELQRLDAHTEEFARLLDEGGPVGKKLEFLTQEMQRESATVSSKADDVSVSHPAMEIRANVHQMKELAANVE